MTGMSEQFISWLFSSLWGRTVLFTVSEMKWQAPQLERQESLPFVPCLASSGSAVSPVTHELINQGILSANF